MPQLNDKVQKIVQHQLGHLVKDRYMEDENVSGFWDVGGVVNPHITR